jgi:hypothetical protein
MGINNEQSKMVPCQKCRFYVHTLQECRIRAPALTILPGPAGEISKWSFFPPMKDGFGCGEGVEYVGPGTDA